MTRISSTMDLHRSRSSRYRSDEKRVRNEDEDGRSSKRSRLQQRSRSRDRERDSHRSSRKHRDKEGDRDREKSIDKEERNGKDREREKDKDRESKGRDHEKDQERDRSRRSRSRSERHRSQEREKSQEIEPKERETKDRDRDRRSHKDKKEDKVEPEADPERDQRTVFASTTAAAGAAGTLGPYSGGARRLYVGNIHVNMSEDDLREIFEAFGTVELVQVPRDETGLCKGFGFVQFARLEDARNALNLNGELKFAGRAIKVSAVTDQTEVPEAGQQQNTGGLSLKAQSQALLMQKLDRSGTASSTGLTAAASLHGGVSMISPLAAPAVAGLAGAGIIPAATYMTTETYEAKFPEVSAVTDQTEVPEAGQQQNTGGLSEEEELAQEAALYVSRAKLQKAALENFGKRIPEPYSPNHTFPETLGFLRPYYGDLEDILEEMDYTRNHLTNILTVLKLEGEKSPYRDIVDWPEVGGKSVYELRWNELKAELRNHKLGDTGNLSHMQLRLALHIRKKDNKYFGMLRGKPIHELTDFDLKSELRLRLLRVGGTSDELVLRLAKAVNHGIQITEDEKSLVPSTWDDREEAVKDVDCLDYPVAFLDLEFKHSTIIEVGIILVNPNTWNSIEFSTFIRQSEKFMKFYVGRSNFPRKMLEHDYKASPTFSDVHETIFHCLQGRIVVGHSIESNDLPLIRDRCFDLGLRVPVPDVIIDTYKWFDEKTDKSLYPKLKLEELAKQFELGEQTHRALDDCNLNIEVFKRVLASKNLLEIIEAKKSGNKRKKRTLRKLT